MLAGAVALVLAVAACDSRRGIADQGTGLRAASPSENVVTIRVHGKGRYAVDDAKNLGERDLGSVLSRKYAARPGTKVVRVLGYPGVSGYDVVLAVNAARAAGARRVDGIADFSEDGSTGNHKTWSEEIEPLPASASPDTANH
jgi:biopolymer transport protein ExbD